MDELTDFMTNYIQEMSDEELVIFNECAYESFILELEENQKKKGK